MSSGNYQLIWVWLLKVNIKTFFTCHDNSVWQWDALKTISTSWEILMHLPWLASFNQSFSGGKDIRNTKAASDKEHLIIINKFYWNIFFLFIAVVQGPCSIGIGWIIISFLLNVFTHPLHIIIVEEATTMVSSALVQLRKIFHPSTSWISAHICQSIISPSQYEHLRHLNGTSLPEKETMHHNVTNFINQQISYQ